MLKEFRIFSVISQESFFVRFMIGQKDSYAIGIPSGQNDSRI